LNVQKKKLEEELADLKRQTEALGSQADESSVRRLETELQEVKDKLDHETSAKTAMMKSKKIAESELEGLKDELKRTKEARLKLEKEKRDAESKLNEIKNSVEVHETSEELRDLTKNQSAQLKELKEKFDREIAERKKNEDQKRGLISELEDLQFRYDQEQKAVSNFARSKVKGESEVEELEARIAQTREDAEKLNDQRRELEKQLRTAKTGSVMGRPNFDQTDLKRLEDNTKDAHDQEDRLKKQIETLEKNNRILEDELEDLKILLESGGGSKEK